MSPRAAWRLESLGFTDVYDYGGGKSDWTAFGLPIEGSDAGVPTALTTLQADAPTVPFAATVGEVTKRFPAGGWTWLAVVNQQNIVLGRLRSRDVEGVDAATPVEALMDAGPSTYRPDVPCEQILDAMERGRFENAFITDPDGRWLGLLTRQDAESAHAAWTARQGAESGATTE